MKKTTIAVIAGASAAVLAVLTLGTLLLFYYRPTIEYAYIDGPGTPAVILLVLGNLLGFATIVGLLLRSGLRKRRRSE